MSGEHYRPEHLEQVLKFYQKTKYNPRRETLRPHVDNAYPILKERARDYDLIGYKELADQIGTDERRYLSVILGTISRIETKENRPPLSCVAVRKRGKMPNDMFFELLDDLDYNARGSTKNEIFENIREDLQNQWTVNRE